MYRALSALVAPAVLATALCLLPPALFAQEPQVIPAPGVGGVAPMDGYLWHVRGLPPGQPLPVYSGAGPAFRVILMLEEGTPIERLNCKESRGGFWCRVATLGRPRISGWVDGRFLLEEAGFASPEDLRPSTDPLIVIDPFEHPPKK